MMNYMPSSFVPQIAGFGAPMAPAISAPGTAPAAPAVDLNSIASFGGGAGAGAAGAFAPVDPTASPMGAPQQGFMQKAGGWLSNGQNLATVFQGISALTGAYLGFQQLRLAKENMALQKESYRTNIQNSTQAYNTSLEDRIRGRTAAYAGKEQDVQSYLSANRLSSTPKG